MSKGNDFLHMQFEYKGFSNNTLFLISVILVCLRKKVYKHYSSNYFYFSEIFSCQATASTGYTGIHLDQMHFSLCSLWLQFLPYSVPVRSFMPMSQSLLCLDHACQYGLFVF